MLNLLSSNAVYLVDLGALLVMLVLAIVGAKKGGIRSLLGFASTIIAIALAFMFAKKGATLLNNWFHITESLSGKIENTLLGLKGFAVDLSETGVKEALAGVNLPDFVKDFLVKELASQVAEQGTTLAAEAGVAIAQFISVLIAWFVIFLVSKILIALLGKLLTAIVESIDLLEKLNILLGVLFGLVKGFLIVCGVLAILSVIPSQGIVDFMDSTLALGYLFHHNPLMKIFALLL